MKRIIKIYEILTTVLTVIVLAAACALVIPRLFGIRPYNVKTGSMEPTIHTGALAYINTHDTNAEVGDIMTFKISSDSGAEILVTHRVFDIKDNEIYFKGDANNSPDAVPVSKDSLVGTYLFSIPWVGDLLQKINVPIVVIIAVWILLLNFLAMHLRSKYADKTSVNEETEKSHEE